MSTVNPVAAKAKSGDLGTGQISCRADFTRGHVFLSSRARPGPEKPRRACNSCSKAPMRARNASTSRSRRPSVSLREGAASHGWSLDERLEVFELLPPESLLDSEQQQSLLYSSDLELGETTKQIFEAVERTRPSRVVLDSLSEIRLLAQSSLRYRRQILAIKHYFAKFNTTVLLLDDLTAETADKTVHSVAHGVLRLEELAPAYGAERRRGAGHQISRRQVSRRLSRRHHHDRRTECFSATGRIGISHQLRTKQDVERHRRTGPAARRRRRSRARAR